MATVPRTQTTSTAAVLCRWPEWLAWLALAAVLAALVPLFLRMPLTPDASFYDIAARHLLRGGAPEKDFLFLPPPGMVWALTAVRVLLGGSSVAARAADLAVVAGSVVLLVAWLRAAGVSRAGRVWSAGLLFAFYLTTTEWVQVQPDTWMLLPALAALHLRRRRLRTPTGAGPRWLASVAEGALWGAACLVKPYVLIPGLLVVLVSAVLARRSGPGWLGRLVADGVGLLAGGLLMGALWQGWLAAEGAWHDYWLNARDYRGDYYMMAPAYGLRLRYLFGKLRPWGLVHFAALLLSAGALFGAARGRARSGTAAAASLLAAFYVGWLFQAHFVQWQFDYHTAPTVLLALALVIAQLGRVARPLPYAALLALFGVAAIAAQPACRPGRLALWPDCLRGGDSPELRDRLALYRTSPTSVDLGRVADYLRRSAVGDRDVLCYDLSTTQLQIDLGIRPATRHLYPSIDLFFLARHRTAIGRELRAGPQRYVVTAGDSPWEDDRRPDANRPEPGADTALQPWPYSEPVAFRAGRYVVRRATTGNLAAH